jgi:hypothetical protein
MGLYAQRVLPRIIEAGCGIKALAPYRQRVCDGLGGEVIELGFGSGLNVPYYPDTVRQVAAVEPADLGWRLAEDRVRDSDVPVRRAGLDGQRLPFPDARFTVTEIDEFYEPGTPKVAGADTLGVAVTP